jgi:acetoin utilization protein AcuB
MNAKRPERIPPITAVMTPFPWHVHLDDHIGHAREVMRERGIRHLPVTDGGELVGIVTDRDIGLVENATREPAEREALRVRDVCVLDAYVVELSEPLDRVLYEMAERHIDSALVVKRGRLAGIFTSSDVCHHFGQFLRMIFDRGGDEVA